MFVKLDNGHALCVQAYRDVQKKAIVPPVNELWRQVEDYVVSAGWHKMTEQEISDFLNPPPSLDEQFQAEMDALNAQYDRDMIDATNKYNVAVARDGSTETEKVNDARAWIADLDAQYDADQLAILNKYYGE